ASNKSRFRYLKIFPNCTISGFAIVTSVCTTFNVPVLEATAEMTRSFPSFSKPTHTYVLFAIAYERACSRNPATSLPAFVTFPAEFKYWYAGTANAIIVIIIPITTNNSTSVNPLLQPPVLYFKFNVFITIKGYY